jgi:COMPASS component SWD3
MRLFSPAKTQHCRQSNPWTTRSLELLNHPKKSKLTGRQRSLYAHDYRDRLLAIAEIFDQREAGIPLLLEALRDPHARVRELAFNCLSIWPQQPEVASVLAAARYRQFKCQRTLKHHSHPITAIAVSPDNQTLLSIAAGEDQFYRWDLATGTIAQTFANPEGAIAQGIFSHDGDYLYTNAPHHRISVWSVATGTIVQQFVGHTDDLRSVGDHRVTQLTQTGQTLISGSADGTIGLWDLGSGELQKRLTGHRGPITAIVISPDGQTIVSAALDQTIRIWQRDTGKIQRIYQFKSNIHSLAIHPTQPIFWSGDRQARLSSWDYQTHQHCDTLSSWSDRATHQIRPSPNGEILFQTCGSSINLWHPTTGWPIAQLISHRAPTTAIALTSDGETLISGSDDRTIKIWGV